MSDSIDINDGSVERTDQRSDSQMIGGDSRPVSALARGVQITEFAESRVNPTPQYLEESDLLLEQYLSPGKLQLLTGVDNLEIVESLELKVDSRETSLGNFGSLLPNLVELKLSGSCIAHIRDLGSSLRKLRVLWLTRCGLEELDGISSMLSLKELYLEYNEISELSPLSMLEELEILDLEGNNIDDISQIQYLSLCPKLRRLALDGNPICVCPTPVSNEPDYDYRGAVQNYLPNLQILDDERIVDGVSSCLKHNAFDEDWAYLEELQRDAFLQEDDPREDVVDEQNMPGDRPTTAALRPATSYRPGSALRPSSGFRPMSASRRPFTMSAGSPSSPSRPKTSAANRPVSSDAVEGLEGSSELTLGGVICGNPSKALKQRRKGVSGSKEDIQKGLSKLLQKGAVFKHSEDSEDVTLKAEDEMNSIIEELQSWKQEHDKRMEVLRKSKEAQVLVVDHDEAVNVLSDSEDDSDLDIPRETIDYRPSAVKRHTADLRLKSPVSPHSPDQAQASASRTSPGNYLAHKTKSLNRSSNSPEANPGGSSGYDDDNQDENNFEDYFERPSSTGFRRPLSQSKSRGEMFGDGDELSRPRSRGRVTEEGLAPLRAPSPTSAQIINSLRSRQIESPTPQKPRKLKVGPTGLPGSSQQPVIKNSLVPPPSRSGLVPNPRSTSSRANIALLPSQPRLPRQLPDPPSLVPHPPNNS